MSNASGGVFQLSYGSFYLPSLAFGYLSTLSENPLIQFFPQISLPGPTLEPVHLFYLLTVLTLLGALQAHGIARAIYGPEGPSVRPKHKSVQIRHELAIVLGEEPEDIPVIPCRIAQRGFLTELLDYINYRMKKFQSSVPMSPIQQGQFERRNGEIPSKHRLETGVKQLQEIGELWSWWKLPRVLYFAPMGLVRHITLISFACLVLVAVVGTASYAVLLLIFAHFILLFRSKLWAPLPDYYNADALDDRFIAEYKRLEEEAFE